MGNIKALLGQDVKRVLPIDRDHHQAAALRAGDAIERRVKNGLKQCVDRQRSAQQTVQAQQRLEQFLGKHRTMRNATGFVLVSHDRLSSVFGALE